MPVQSTSKHAYAELQPSLGTKQWEVYEALSKHQNMTNTELSKFMGWEINKVVPRVFELRRMGKVECAGKRACRITGKEVYCWQITSKPMTLF